MNDDKEYEKFTKYLSKGFFTINEVRKFIENDFVANVTKEESDNKHPNYVKYAIKLIDGDVYYVYVKPTL